MNSTDIGRPLADFRRAANLTQADVAVRLDVSQEAIAKLERSANPRVSTITGYAQAIGGSAAVSIVVDGVSYPVKFAAPDQAPGPDIQAWCVRGWNDREHERTCLAEGVIAISNGDDFNEPMDERRTDSDLSHLIASAYPNRTARAISTFSGYVRAFGETVSVGDLLVMPLSGHRRSTGRRTVTIRGEAKEVRGYCAAVGTISGAYEFVPGDKDPLFRHRRNVDWFAVVDVTKLGDDIKRSIDAPGTIHGINAQDVARRLLEFRPSMN